MTASPIRTGPLRPGPRRTVRHGFLGRVPYREAEALQARVRAAVHSGEGDEHLLLLEHPHVYTLGRNAAESDLVLGPEARAARGIEVAGTDRGGQVTYHGPGQLVGYPIVDLDPDRRDVRRYVRDLQETIVRSLADFGVTAGVREGQEAVGVWVGDEKIASIGVHLKRWVTTHGFALNVTTDLGYFDGIVACGMPEVRLTSVERLTGRRPSLAEVADRYAIRFGEVFDREMAPFDEEPALAMRHEPAVART